MFKIIVIVVFIFLLFGCTDKTYFLKKDFNAADVNAVIGYPNGAVQFNESGFFGGSSDFTFNDVNNKLYMNGDVNLADFFYIDDNAAFKKIGVGITPSAIVFGTKYQIEATGLGKGQYFPYGDATGLRFNTTLTDGNGNNAYGIRNYFTDSRASGIWTTTANAMANTMQTGGGIYSANAMYNLLYLYGNTTFYSNSAAAKNTVTFYPQKEFYFATYLSGLENSISAYPLGNIKITGTAPYFYGEKISLSFLGVYNKTAGTTISVVGVGVGAAVGDANTRIQNVKGIYLEKQSLGVTSNYQVYSVGGNNYFGNGNHAFIGKMAIAKAIPTYPLDVNSDVNGISIYADKNISAAGYLTRTHVYDKSAGSALSKIKDASEYLTAGKIDDSKFDYSKVTYSVNEVDSYKISYEDVNECITPEPICPKDGKSMEDCEKQMPVCKMVTKKIETPVYKVNTHTVVSIDKELALLKQALFELKDCINKSKDFVELKSCVPE
jgi:hypothetical protein